LSEYYTVFDQTPYDMHGLDYIQVGIGKANPSDTIGESLLEKSRQYHEETVSSAFWTILLMICLTVGAAYACVRQQKEPFTNIDNLDYDGVL
jgi:hypothetical protein